MKTKIFLLFLILQFLNILILNNVYAKEDADNEIIRNTIPIFYDRLFLIGRKFCNGDEINPKEEKCTKLGGKGIACDFGKYCKGNLKKN